MLVLIYAVESVCIGNNMCIGKDTSVCKACLLKSLCASLVLPHLSFRNHILSASTSMSSVWCVDSSMAQLCLRERMSLRTSSRVCASQPLWSDVVACSVRCVGV